MSVRRDDMILVDGEEKREQCLSCKKPICPGFCERMAGVGHIKLDGEAARELYDYGYSDKKIANELVSTSNAVRKWRLRNGLVRGVRGKYEAI